MKSITCSGSHLEIGLRHGEEASVEISRGIKFYAGLFQETAKMSWDDVCQTASKFLPYLRREWPGYVEEMNGISQSAHVPFLSILAINVRTEIAYGLSSDGCTALAWKTPSTTFLAQNWDWQQQQAENLIRLTIRSETKPDIDMITEAGIIGKIGLNSVGVGTCLNAIRAHGVDFNRLPCHLALRACLESRSMVEAVGMLHETGVASACHILVADSTGGVGLECTHKDVVDVLMHAESPQVVTHTNHFILAHHPGIVEVNNLPDSPFRLQRINELIAGFEGGEPGLEDVKGFLKDEENFPASINRAMAPGSTVATLFSIAMDLGERRARITIGRPTEGGEEGVLIL